MVAENYIYDGLNKDIKPLKYILRIKPDFKTFVYSGSEEIHINADKSTNKIMLHSNKINLDSISIKNEKTKESIGYQVKSHSNLITLNLDKNIKGNYIISINFHAKNNDQMYGFYRSEYKNETTGKNEYLLSTQFEPNSARAAFPCFDIPSFKSTFKLYLTIENGYDAISNMPIQSSKKTGKYKVIEFKESPKMSTYLLYIGVGKFEYLKGKFGNLPIRVITTEGKSKMGKFALETAKKSLKFYENYFGIKYPMEKLDLIAVPDFAAGAMENWGALTFRENALLYNDKSTSEPLKHNIAITVAHELAHQWFGDLVTMKWWDDLWLNESFATFMSYKAVDFAYPKWDILGELYLDRSSAFLEDGLKNTHPISVEIKKSDDANSIFDSISYEKGSAILDMINDFIGDKPFSKGLNIYLKTFAYSNTYKEDLWDSIQKALQNDKKLKDVSINKMMKSWIENPGYPILDLKSNGKSLNIIQSRFFISGKKINNGNNWIIPMKYKVDETEYKAVIESKSTTINIPNNKRLIINPNQSGFYVTKYETPLIKKIFRDINSKDFDNKMIAGLVSNTYLLLKSSNIRIEEFIDLIEPGYKNISYPSLILLNGYLLGLYSIFYKTKISKKIKDLSLKLNQYIIKTVGFDKSKNDSEINKEVRFNAISNLVTMGDLDTSKKLSDISKKYFKNKSYDIDRNIKSSMYKNYALNGGPKEFEFLKKVYQENKDVVEKHIILSAFGYFNKSELYNKILDYSLSKNVKIQDSIYITSSFLILPGRDKIYFSWLKKNWQKLKNIYEPSTLMLLDFISELSYVNDESLEEEIKQFFSNKANLRFDVKSEYDKVIEKINNNIRMLKNND